MTAVGRSPPTAGGQAGLHNTHLCEGHHMTSWPSVYFFKNKYSSLVAGWGIFLNI